jgi:hypothetical protein
VLTVFIEPIEAEQAKDAANGPSDASLGLSLPEESLAPLAVQD